MGLSSVTKTDNEVPLYLCRFECTLYDLMYPSLHDFKLCRVGTSRGWVGITRGCECWSNGGHSTLVQIPVAHLVQENNVVTMTTYKIKLRGE